MTTYKVIRFFLHGDKRVIDTGLSLEEAQQHCANPETSFTTCTKPELVRLTRERGPWFDGYDTERN